MKSLLTTTLFFIIVQSYTQDIFGIVSKTDGSADGYYFIQNYYQPSADKKLHSVGEIRISKDGHVNIGEWLYYHKDESLKERVIFNDEGQLQHYVFQSHIPNKVNLENGNGVYIAFQPSFVTVDDSVVSQVKDSLLHGESKTYTFLESINKFYLSEEKHFSYGKEISPSISYYSSGEILLKRHFSQADSIIHIEQYYKNGQLSKKGDVINDIKIGIWTHYYENGSIERIENFERGGLIGRYQDFHPNGQLKTLGMYSQGYGSDTLFVENPETYELEMKIIKSDFFPLKNGEWNYYSPVGDLIKTEFYENGKLIQ